MIDDIGFGLVLIVVLVLLADAVKQTAVYAYRRRQRQRTMVIKRREWNTMAPDEPTEAIMEFFTWAHLKSPEAQSMSRGFAELAEQVLRSSPRSAERSVALRKLLEGKDAAVRAVLSANRTPWRERVSTGEVVPAMDAAPVPGPRYDPSVPPPLPPKDDGHGG